MRFLSVVLAVVGAVLLANGSIRVYIAVVAFYLSVALLIDYYNRFRKLE